VSWACTPALIRNAANKTSNFFIEEILDEEIMFTAARGLTYKTTTKIEPLTQAGKLKKKKLLMYPKVLLLKKNLNIFG
jgi:hypothetical protein